MMRRRPLLRQDGIFDTDRAAKGYAALETVLETAKLQVRRVFDVLVELMRKPVLPFLDTSDP